MLRTFEVGQHFVVGPALIAKCVRGEINFGDFDISYNSFYHRCALDGNEANYKEQRLLSGHAARIEIHRRIWDEILIHVCSDENAELDEYRDTGRFGSAEAVRRLLEIAEENHLLDEKTGDSSDEEKT